MFLPLRQNTIDIYYTDTFSKHWQNSMLHVLNKEELDVYHRYGLEERKIEFLLGRYLVKNICSHYLHKKPQEIIITKNEYGKPYLPGSDVKFNISHSYGVVACAATIGAEIGVDIEKISNDITGVVKRFFTPKEIDYLFNLDPGNKNREAYRLWTMKEAYIKAIGKGLFTPLDSFDLFDLFGEYDVFFYSTELNADYYLSVARKNGKNEENNASVRIFRVVIECIGWLRITFPWLIPIQNKKLEGYFL